MDDVVGILEHASGHTQDIVYDLLFTRDRAIALIIKHPADVPYKFSVTELLIGSALGKQSERGDRRRIAEERRRNYREKPIDKLVAADDRNFEILYTMVSSVEVSHSLFHSYLKFTIQRPGAREITIRFTLPRESAPLARGLVDQVLSAKHNKKQ
jgi:hypothetical protein